MSVHLFQLKWKVVYITVLYILGTFVSDLRIEAFQHLSSHQIVFFALYILVFFLIGLITGVGHHVRQQEVALVRVLFVVVFILLLLPFPLLGISRPPFSTVLLSLVQGHSVTFLPLVLGYLAYPSIKGKNKG